MGLSFFRFRVFNIFFLASFRGQGIGFIVLSDQKNHDEEQRGFFTFFDARRRRLLRSIARLLGRQCVLERVVFPSCFRGCRILRCE